ncbi:TonB-dependent receptor plug domain-containing protein [Vibrio sonorensis]|uniref:TonB-dependent receptor plug domain-containing protein n=1 Tax=Vibrio sonorensis TaxID=1004316 RepID=UPI0008D9E227|nr:TonB-dependent receptor plug domain-containing protein [Vibrio sonorensis]
MWKGPIYFLTFLVVFTIPLAKANEQYEIEVASLLNMSLSELMQVEISDVGSLTKTSKSRAPAAVTYISQADIQALGARSMMELLEIMVPGLQMIRHHYELPHMGIRGITSDREDKVMIRVNGRVMNERSARGAITERDFPLMGDIKHINVIRGAGSSLYGLGAVSMVIDIQTFDAESLIEDSIHVRGGAGMQYKALGLNFSNQFDNGLGLYFHSEIADVNGANGQDAPLIYGNEGVSLNTGELIRRGEPMPTISRDWQGYNEEPFTKLHLGIDYNNSHLWLRYTKAGRNIATMLKGQVEPPLGLNSVNEELLSKIGYEQFTATYEHENNIDAVALSWMLSYDRTNIEKQEPFVKDLNSYGEAEIFARMMANWAATDNSDIALGLEYGHEEFGLNNEQSANGRWNTYTVSLLGEWQWRYDNDLTIFAGSRIDKNTYTNTLFSPRLSAVYSSDDMNTYKLLLTQSRRMNVAQRNRRSEREGNSVGDTEALNSIEVRYERAKGNSIAGVSLFYINLDALGWDESARNSITIGKQTQWGLESEYTLFTGSHQLNLSFAYSKLIDFDLYGQNTFITAHPFGYGNDLADWATFSTKIRYRYELTEKTNFISSLRAFWGFDGSRDFRDKQLDDCISPNECFVTQGWEKAYQEQVYMNLGLKHQATPNAVFSLDLYNVLGVFDKDLNKRNYRDSLGDYRSEAVAISAGVILTF